MNLPAINRKTALSLCLSVFLLAPMPALAALSSSDAQRLDQMEQSVFGSTRQKLSEESRLRALEVNLFGKAKTGDQAARLNAIAKVVGKSGKSQYLPPVAAEMDRSAFSSEQAKPAPDAVSSSSDSSDAPAYASGSSSSSSGSQSDAEKDLLRQALEKHNQGDMGGAMRLFNQVLAMDPRSVDANFNLGAMAEDGGDLATAKRYYQAAAALDPSDHDLQDALNGVQQKMHQAQLAQQQSAQVQNKVRLKQLADDAAVAYKAGKYDQAINDLQRIAAETPNDANVQFGLGQALRGKGDLNGARQSLSRAVSLAPDNQLYRSTLTDLDQDIHRQGGQQIADGPRPAPDYRGGGGSRSSGGNPDGTQNFDNSDMAQDNRPTGDIQPFTSQGEGKLYGHEVANGMRGSGLGGLGMGALGGLMGGSHYYGGSGTTRLARGAMTGAMTGAAMGALTNMHGPGGMRAGAVRGALYGGLFGLMTGF